MSKPKKMEFRPNDYVVYPAHGVGQIISIEEQEIAGLTLELFVISFAMWSRRAQEYEQKINSGDLIAIAEVGRDLHRADDQREQSYSERQLYEAALERLTREVAAVNGADETDAQREVGDVLLSRAAAA